MRCIGTARRVTAADARTARRLGVSAWGSGCGAKRSSPSWTAYSQSSHPRVRDRTSLGPFPFPALKLFLDGRPDQIQPVLPLLQGSVHPRLGPFGQRQVDVFGPEFLTSHLGGNIAYMNLSQTAPLSCTCY